MLDWTDLRFLLAVARARTLSGAARKLGCDQTTVGRRIDALEKSLDRRLFRRTPDGYFATSEGEVALARAAPGGLSPALSRDRAAAEHGQSAAQPLAP